MSGGTGAEAVVRVALAVLVALATAFAAWLRLRSTPEPDDGPEGAWAKPAYADVASPRLLAVAMALAGVLAALAASRVQGTPAPAAFAVLAAWALAAGLGTVAALCDLRTTYLPSSLMRPWGALTAVALLGVVATLPGRGAAAPGVLLRVAGCAVAARLVFWLWWRVGGRLGFADVRLATILAADAAMVSLATWSRWLVLGTALGAAWGIATSITRRRRPSALGSAFPYGPALALGAWLALAVA